MPVFHFIYHAYRSWNADHPKGYYQHGEKGLRPPSERLADFRDRVAKQPPMEFSDQDQQHFLTFIFDICSRRNWHVHAVGMDTTHVHIVVSWQDKTDPDDVKDRIKNLLSFLLNKNDLQMGRRVFSEGSGDRRVRDMAHLHFLVEEYLPAQGGVYWSESRIQAP